MDFWRLRSEMSAIAAMDAARLAAVMVRVHGPVSDLQISYF